MWARMVDQVQHYFKKMFPAPDEWEEIAQKVRETGQEVEVGSRAERYIFRKRKDGTVEVEIVAHVATFELLDKDDVLRKYKDIVDFMKQRRTVTLKELRKHFSFGAESFIEIAKKVGLVKSTPRGYKLVEADSND